MSTCQRMQFEEVTVGSEFIGFDIADDQHYVAQKIKPTETLFGCGRCGSYDANAKYEVFIYGDRGAILTHLCSDEIVLIFETLGGLHYGHLER